MDQIRCKAIAYSNKIDKTGWAVDKGNRRELHKKLHSLGLYYIFRYYASKEFTIRSYTSVNTAFTWENTSEGFDFWNNVAGSPYN